MSEQIAYNIDCMEYMKTVPDKYFDLAVVDPPYGGGAKLDNSRSQIGNVERERERESCVVAEQIGNQSNAADSEGCLTATISASRTGGKWATKYQVGGVFRKDIRHWDIAPSKEYFEELARVSKNQIIWGGNYFYLPPTRCFLIWRKLTISENFTMAMAEYAWTSFNDNAKVFEYVPQGKGRIHPTEKPVALYEWIFKRYAHKGDRIFDSHLGSGTSRIAAKNMDLDFVGCEIDATYFDLQEKRWEQVNEQMTMDIPNAEWEQEKLL